ncbi:electron transfer flavoprotein subunit beta/FixA family protein [Paraburkholderia phenoliruptrix]|uniref:electron transfer flavoprotein subunit beta/FixA family protein n=1 Tax=Paraburkholderia phenoliruptrix TaxID=252970 RepID=UPI002869B1DC|nr:electron transfer flavoprotein subunit beta/FixA family protein [Paraburkholderia phenoliruptrix]WMY11077.1 electron transfer flavoprotein subunit beta/FixA family protein [Paraburkholderia phenoliruptrix]
MKILVCVKRVADPNVKVRVRSDKTGVDLSNIKMTINPFDEIAVEAAIRLKERGVATEVVVVSCGPAASQDALRTALAMGADRGILVQTDAELQPLAVAKLVKWIVEKESPEVIVLGKQAIDDDANQTGQLLAALLDVPQATFASAIEREGDRMLVTRETDDGREAVEVSLPAVITADLRLNEPRYVTLPNLMKAKKKPLDTLDAASLGVDIAPKFKTVSVEEPAARKPGEIVLDVAALVARLRAETAPN